MIRALIINHLAPRLLAMADRRPPDVEIGGAENPYMRRWWVVRRKHLSNTYLHHFKRSDDDRALHDHPWASASIILRGSYTEHTINAGGVHVKAIRRAGEIVVRGAKAAHRIELHDGPCWTLFITGPRVRSWGFHCPNGWRHWRVFTDPTGSGIGAGCGEDDGAILNSPERASEEPVDGSPRTARDGSTRGDGSERRATDQAARTRPILSVSPETCEPAPALAASTGRQQRDTLGVTAGETATFPPKGDREGWMASAPFETASKCLPTGTGVVTGNSHGANACPDSSVTAGETATSSEAGGQ